ncbi:MAG: gamma-glutamylcyclotransferase [Acidovorax sp.]|nr:gamma-glutamylcyclotransferase [Acidovorax sp.]
MTLLTRQNLGDGSFRRGLALPPHLGWSDAQVAQSFAQAWAARPPGPVWVFGYGSLMWNPLLAFEERRVATLGGWHRSFCLRSIAGRGSPEHPGRVLSLEPGGEVRGVALRLPPSQAESELRLLWTREMTSGAYRPLWCAVELPGGRQLQAATFVADPCHPQHEPDASPATVARLTAVARGAFGPNVDYVRALARALQQEGLRDPYVDEILQALPPE